MRSITTLPNDSFTPLDQFSHLDPALQHPPQPQPQYFPHPAYPNPAFAVPPSPVMDLQYILSPSILLDDQQQQQQQPAHPPLVFQEKHQLGPAPASSEPVPSSSRTAPVAQHVHPNPDDAIISFDSKTRSFPKPTKATAPTVDDPCAEEFLRKMLGDKWGTFSTSLFERRLGSRGKAKQGNDDDPKAGASAVEFLVKVEVVKAVLRDCVPHPYNPRKSRSHEFSGAPSGHVTLTRSTVLSQCRWSNTQFSYWARRSEAVSVLAEHDPRLRAVAVALERRLRGDPPPEDEDEGAAVTGKGLDSIIEDVKKRTGKSQFLRGKHSSLDPFGTPPQDPAAPPPPPQYAMPTFQAERYDHSTRYHNDWDEPSSHRPHTRPPPVSPPAPPKRRLLQQPPPPPPPPAREPSVSASASASSASASSAQSSSPTPSYQASPSPRATRAAARKAAVAADDNVHHFPVSDSRSEVEAPVGTKRKPDAEDAPSNKRARTAEASS